MDVEIATVCWQVCHINLKVIRHCCVQTSFPCPQISPITAGTAGLIFQLGEATKVLVPVGSVCLLSQYQSDSRAAPCKHPVEENPLWSTVEQSNKKPHSWLVRVRKQHSSIITHEHLTAFLKLWGKELKHLKELRAICCNSRMMTRCRWVISDSRRPLAEIFVFAGSGWKAALLSYF